VEHLPEETRSLLLEVYSALDINALTLVAIGVRTVIDHVMRGVVGELGTFADRLLKLEAKGLISTRDRQHLAIVVDAGNAAAHRSFHPQPRDIVCMMDSMEHLLKPQVLAQQTKALKKATPQKKRKRKPGLPLQRDLASRG
jgi:hypothetical protein